MQTSVAQTTTRWEVSSSVGHFYAATLASAHAWACAARRDGATKLRLTEHVEQVQVLKLPLPTAKKLPTTKSTKRRTNK